MQADEIVVVKQILNAAQPTTTQQAHPQTLLVKLKDGRSAIALEAIAELCLDTPSGTELRLKSVLVQNAHILLREACCEVVIRGPPVIRRPPDTPAPPGLTAPISEQPELTNSAPAFQRLPVDQGLPEALAGSKSTAKSKDVPLSPQLLPPLAGPVDAVLPSSGNTENNPEGPDPLAGLAGLGFTDKVLGPQGLEAIPNFRALQGAVEANVVCCLSKVLLPSQEDASPTSCLVLQLEDADGQVIHAWASEGLTGYLINPSVLAGLQPGASEESQHRLVGYLQALNGRFASNRRHTMHMRILSGGKPQCMNIF